MKLYVLISWSKDIAGIFSTLELAEQMREECSKSFTDFRKGWYEHSIEVWEIDTTKYLEIK